MDEDLNPYQSPSAEADADSRAKPKRHRVLMAFAAIWNLALILAAAASTFPIVPFLFVQFSDIPWGVSLSFAVRCIAIGFDAISDIAWTWLVLGTFSSWTWRPMVAPLRWLYAVFICLFVVRIILRTAIDQWDMGRSNYGQYLPFAMGFAFFSAPIVILGTGYFGLIARVARSLFARRPSDAKRGHSTFRNHPRLTKK
jgi:hypothetical protein